MLRFLSTVLKIGLVSLITGAVLAEFDVSAADLLAGAGLTPEELADYAVRTWRWALPNIILGSMIVLPVWLVIYLFRPPRG
ncbi:DUF6460 domain-containing protein [Stappia sp. MMSF_3263]|uniref:DUF6460 domain-containing protein n=1 Tax=Stappia sp. MMSF_3263 TaxID=3046693 RepID=UPI00273DCE89|nr:DUF6460 domain-containing protein [Stappia sp. MMSF_3263]